MISVGRCDGVGKSMMSVVRLLRAEYDGGKVLSVTRSNMMRMNHWRIQLAVGVVGGVCILASAIPICAGGASYDVDLDGLIKYSKWIAIVKKVTPFEIASEARVMDSPTSPPVHFSSYWVSISQVLWTHPQAPKHDEGETVLLTSSAVQSEYETYKLGLAGKPRRSTPPRYKDGLDTTELARVDSFIAFIGDPVDTEKDYPLSQGYRMIDRGFDRLENLLKVTGSIERVAEPEDDPVSAKAGLTGIVNGSVPPASFRLTLETADTRPFCWMISVKNNEVTESCGTACVPTFLKPGRFDDAGLGRLATAILASPVWSAPRGSKPDTAASGICVSVGRFAARWYLKSDDPLILQTWAIVRRALKPAEPSFSPSAWPGSVPTR